MSNVIETVQELMLTYGLNLLGSLAIFLVGRWLARRLVNYTGSLLEKTRVDSTLVTFFSHVLYYLLLVVVIIAAMTNAGIPTTTVVAAFGAATLAVGLALQDSLSNLAAGVLIILLRPYKLDDFVEINGAEGYVTSIKILHTTLKSRDSKIIFIPNKEVIAGNITNYSKEEWIRLDLVYGIGYDDDLLKAKRVLQEIMQATAGIAPSPAPVVAVKELGDNSINFAVRPYVKVRDYVPVSFAINEQVKLRFDEEGISIPFPQRDVHLYTRSALSAAERNGDQS